MWEEENKFIYQAPTTESVEKIKVLRDKYDELYKLINNTFPVSNREKSLAITNLEQSNMWINKAIVFWQ